MSGRRASNRIKVNIDVRLFLGNMFYSGTITNISKSGVLIYTNVDMSRGESFIVLLPAGKEVTKLFARAKRITGENRISSSIGAEITGHAPEYAAFVEDLESSLYI